MGPKPRNGAIPKPETSKLFNSSGIKLKKILWVNLLSYIGVKLFCLRSKWSPLWLISTKISLLKEVGDENRQNMNPLDSPQMDYFSLLLTGSTWKHLSKKYQRPF